VREIRNNGAWNSAVKALIFGEGCMNGHKLRISTTTAMEDCLITSITKSAMVTALHEEPKFSELFMAYLLTSRI
jgi:CRP-like cAMP-binding protein